ncbi:Imm21 family immunity protein [Vandammella animalimorsus]|nr:Imm21 family immunity protein [Vandammella animalimorsus]
MAKKINNIKKYSNWFESEGGPLILISEENCFHWKGVFGEEQDYWRLIDEEIDFVDKKEINGKKFIAFGDEPLPARVISCDNGIIFLRWVAAEDDLDIFNFINFICFEKMEILGEINIDLKSGKYFIFDAALPGETEEKYEIYFEKNVSVATTYLFRPGGDDEFQVNVFLY